MLMPHNLGLLVGSEAHLLHSVQAGLHPSILHQRSWTHSVRTTRTTRLNYLHHRSSSSRRRMHRFCARQKTRSLLCSRLKPVCSRSVLYKRSWLLSSRVKPKSRTSYMRMPSQRARWSRKGMSSFVKRDGVHGMAGSGYCFSLLVPVYRCCSCTTIERCFLPLRHYLMAASPHILLTVCFVTS